MAGLAMAVAGCGLAAPRVTASMIPAAAHEAIPSSAGEGSLGLLEPGGPRKHAGPVSGSPDMAYLGGALFGGNDGLARQEHALGRKLAIIRTYYHIGEIFPVASDRERMAAGATLMVSLDSDGPSYASIAAGNQDATIRAFLRSVNQAAVRYHLRAIFISFEHEPDGPQHAGLGSAAQFARAWDHVHALAAWAGLNWNNGGRLHWVLILIHGTYEHPTAYWPGNGEVDIVAADGYNSYHCGKWNPNLISTPARLFDPLLSFARSHGGMPVIVAEWGGDTVVPSLQVQFIQRMQRYVASNPQIKAAMYWDDGGTPCNYRVDGRPASLAALAAMGRAPALQGKAVF
jgi:hypothetical protein